MDAKNVVGNSNAWEEEEEVEEEEESETITYIACEQYTPRALRASAFTPGLTVNVK